MSFRLFIYYCALVGGWCGFVAWVFILPSVGFAKGVGNDGLRGLILGLLIALGLTLVDTLWNLSLKQAGQIFLRVGVALGVACVGGLLGGLLASLLQGKEGKSPFLVLGWIIAGLLIGASVGVFEILAAVVRQQDTSGARKKLINGMIGGTIGGLLGGVIYYLGMTTLPNMFGKNEVDMWGPRSIGYVALGACIGLLVGLAQVLLKEAWIKVESGFRAGREKILGKGEMTIGRAESCDIGLFGDNKVERLHAKILKRGANFFVLDNNTAAGTFLNGRPVTKPELLKTGDAIQVGGCVLRFGERQKQKLAQGT